MNIDIFDVHQTCMIIYISVIFWKLRLILGQFDLDYFSPSLILFYSILLLYLFTSSVNSLKYRGHGGNIHTGHWKMKHYVSAALLEVICIASCFSIFLGIIIFLAGFRPGMGRKTSTKKHIKTLSKGKKQKIH